MYSTRIPFPASGYISSCCSRWVQESVFSLFNPPFVVVWATPSLDSPWKNSLPFFVLLEIVYRKGRWERVYVYDAIHEYVCHVYGSDWMWQRETAMLVAASINDLWMPPWAIRSAPNLRFNDRICPNGEILPFALPTRPPPPSYPSPSHE